MPVDKKGSVLEMLLRKKIGRTSASDGSHFHAS